MHSFSAGLTCLLIDQRLLYPQRLSCMLLVSSDSLLNRQAVLLFLINGDDVICMFLPEYMKSFAESR